MRPAAVVALVAIGLGSWALAPSFGAGGFLTTPGAKKLFFTKPQTRRLFYTKGQLGDLVYTKAQADNQFYAKAQSDERYYTKTQADDQFFSKSQSDDRYYTKAQSDSNFLSATGEIRINASPQDWVNPGSAVITNPTSNATSFLSGPTASTFVTVAPTLPTVLAGKPLRLVGVNACYYTTNLTTVTAAAVSRTTDDGSPSGGQLVSDGTDRTDDACRDYLLPTPVTLGPQDNVDMEFFVDFAGGGGNTFTAGRATFILTP